MKDLNFFEPYLEKKKLSINRKYIYIILGALFASFVLSYTIFSQIKIRQINKDIEKLEATINDEKINKKVEDIKNKKEEIEKFKQSLEKLKSIDNIIEEEDVITTYLIKDITSKMPKDVFFTSIGIYPDSIQMIGVAKDKYSIAELGKNLDTVEEFKEIFIENISFEEGNYIFNLNINLKEDVNTDEEPIDEESGDSEDEQNSNEE
ncbi:type IV pilus assembly protein PilN [Keratinibaculum paraultunense]|uniref:Type IV pilus assembly protein PilN n=1 Tax=Keratinibaculum paraultunense TaxID=1278232 RepID=A0A4V2UUK8_9FIRM|nr:PilN domain-containing protein [Keratinibaculum paraultunense]QQY80594.1 PilN domain-containing protein [Keratinibaculum paraultunense]TCS91324.1 type IV pilus assembly protein PilN [Keratinibaculum paraultunense]